MRTADSFSAFNGGGVGFGYIDALIPVRVRPAGFAVALLLGNLDLRLVDGAGGRFLTERVDVSGLVGDVLDIDVDQAKSDLFEFDFNAVVDILDQFFAVGIDILDGHGRDDNAHLTEDDVPRQFLDVFHAQSEEAFGGVFHNARFGGNANRKRGGRVDTDILLRQPPLPA